MLAQEDNEASTEHNIEVVLRFSPSAVRRLKQTIWHSTQQIKDLPDGSCLFTARVENNSILDIVPWIHGWGSAVEVLKPEELRKKMTEYGGPRCQDRKTG
jgi:predicted DNA-binding transcriptional regulator YafY